VDVRTYYDYFSKLRLWEEYFGRDALVVHVFERYSLSGGDIVTDFAEQLGVGVAIPPCRVNEGISRREFLLTHKLLQLGAAPEEVQKLKPFMRADAESLCPARATARAFFAEFAASNRALNERYLPHASGLAFVDDFDSYPEEGNDQLTLRDLSAWTPGLLGAGLRNPLGLRDALLAERLQAAPPMSDAEQQALVECLRQTAALAPQRKSWLSALRRRKRYGR